MLPAGIIDTGAIIAIAEFDDAWHEECLQALRSVHIPLLTTEAVLTEVFHLVGRTYHDKEKAWRFVNSGALSVRPMTDSDLPALHGLMQQYKDRPMDFADATLVHLATREAISLVVTVDFDDFETYRMGGKKRFTILPDRNSR
ncbi:MAG: PIN domain-containing protein [Terriglobales bacterium]